VRDIEMADPQFSLVLGDGRVGVGQLLTDRERFPVCSQGVLLVADLVGQITEVQPGLGQPCQRFGARVMVGLEAVS
jgi:hypothetical protein